VNHVLNPIGNRAVDEGQTLSFTVSASDQDGDALTYEATNLPPGATFDPNTRTFSWTPTSGQVGTYPNVRFEVIDSGAPWHSEDENITITVNNVGLVDVDTNVSVTPPATDSNGNPIIPLPVTLTFADVTGSGTTSVVTKSQGAPLPDGFKLGNPPTYYSISTSASFTGSVQVCIDYTGISYHNENNLKLNHYDGTTGVWTDITTSLDTVNHIICGSTTSFSDFAIFEPSNQAPVLAPIGDQTVLEGLLALATNRK
jgi:hypothetical protein